MNFLLNENEICVIVQEINQNKNNLDFNPCHHLKMKNYFVFPITIQKK